MIKRFKRWWRIRRTYRQLCEAMAWSERDKADKARWKNR